MLVWSLSRAAVRQSAHLPDANASEAGLSVQVRAAVKPSHAIIQFKTSKLYNSLLVTQVGAPPHRWGQETDYSRLYVLQETWS